MKLNQINKKQLIKKIIFGLVVLIIGGFFLKVGLWENSYISEKTGSKRAIAAAPAEEEVDETEITKEQIKEHIVPADHPRYLSIDSIGVKNARILSIGTKASGELSTPAGIFDAGWYNASAKPGTGGTIVIDGHNGGPTKIGIFKHLPNVKVGEKIKIERGDGTIFTYTVKENKTVLLSESNDYMKTAFKSPEPNKESLTIITCTGDWSSVQKTYLSRQFLRATLDN